MNYLPVLGYWFYGATGASELASYYSSYGLLATAPGITSAEGSFIQTIMTVFTNLFGEFKWS